MAGNINGMIYQEFNNRINLQLPVPILMEALTHPSFKSVNKNSPDNQRLEVVGDAVIDLLVINWLYKNSSVDEGVLTRSRSEIVQNSTLADAGSRLEIDTVLRCAPAYHIQEKDLADAVEALFGAKFQVSGLIACQPFLLFLFEEDLVKTLEKEETNPNVWGRNEKNPKNLVQEFFQQRGLPNPMFQLQHREGLDHNPQYYYSCQGTYQNQIIVGRGSGKSKKEAQKNAALDLLQKLQQIES
ncbi:MAG: ribonuclease III family protein [Candidatus Hodarchaeales archaeon]|jgi:ribonuclease-3